MPRQTLEVENETDPVTVADTSSGEMNPIAVDESAPHPTVRYELLQVLGKGAMGEVLVAREGSLSRKVAFKRMAPNVAKDRGLTARFLREMQVTAQLDHPNVVPVYAHEPAPDGTPGYAMKLVRGRTLTVLTSSALSRRSWRRSPPARRSPSAVRALTVAALELPAEESGC
jgi:serine/threonine-protein kinase